jgi:polyferredoxin
MTVISASKQDTTKALLLGVVGMVIMPIFFSISAMYVARRGMRNGERGAVLAFLLGVIGVFIGAVILVRTLQFQLQ